MQISRLKLICLLCKQKNRINKNRISREATLCMGCGATWRDMAIADAVGLAVNKFDNQIADYQSDFSLKGLGVGDSTRLASLLSQKFSYTNSYIDDFPKFDLTQEVPEIMMEAFDFVTCSDVLEHVVPPIDIAIKNLYKITKPGGGVVLSVPLIKVDSKTGYLYSGDSSEILRFGMSEEYYPGLIDYKIIDQKILWSNPEGKFVDNAPEFHGGTGLVLTFRRWSLEDLQHKLLQVGFKYAVRPADIKKNEFFDIEDAGIILARK